MRYRKWLSVLLATIMIGGLAACGSSGKSAALQDGKFTLEDTTLDFGSNQVTADKVDMKTVTVKDDEKPEGLVSDLYEVTIDLELEEPVTLSLPLDEATKPDDPDAAAMLGLGREYTFDDGSKETLFAYVPATVADGRVTATFVPAEALEELEINGATVGAKASGQRLRLGIFWVTTFYENGGHFKVHFPVQRGSFFLDNNTRDSLLNDLEAVYDYYLAKNYAYAKRSSWPMDVYIESMKDVGAYSYGWFGADGTIYLNRSLFSPKYEQKLVQSLLAHEFFHFVQLNYGSAIDDFLWFDEATATYFEGLAVGGLPSIVSQYRENIFKGVFPEDNSAEQGYARAPLVSFLASTKQEDFIRTVYESAAGGTDWDEALRAATGEPQTWAGDFYEALLTNKVGNYDAYPLHGQISGEGEPEIGKVLDLKVPTPEELETIVENDEIPLLGETTVDVAAYGAQVVAITIDDAQHFRLNENVDPVVTVSEGADVRVLDAYSKTVLVHKSTGGAVPLANFKNGIEGQHRFLILVTGLHSSGTQTYTVKVELQPYPTLDELVGTYDDGVATITEVYLSPELEAELQAPADDEDDEDDLLGCDIEVVELLRSMVGVPQEQTLVVAKTGDITGTLTMIAKDDEEDDEGSPLDFTYENGIMHIELIQEGVSMEGTIYATYGKNKDVLLDGELIISAGDEQFRITTTLTGSKPLPAPAAP